MGYTDIGAGVRLNAVADRPFNALRVRHIGCPIAMSTSVEAV